MIVYFTDGSASPNPGPGGFAVIKNGAPWIIGGEYMAGASLLATTTQTTNIRMEGLAMLAALTDAENEACEIHSDSEFWINVLTKWAPSWARNNWTKKGGIKNLDIVRPLYEKFCASNAKLIWVRGHNGHDQNELADEWANRARKLKVTSPTRVVDLDLS